MRSLSAKLHDSKNDALILAALVLSGFTFTGAVWAKHEVGAIKAPRTEQVRQAAPLTVDEQVREMLNHD